jgi:hypothetical protein
MQGAPHGFESCSKLPTTLEYGSDVGSLDPRPRQSNPTDQDCQESRATMGAKAGRVRDNAARTTRRCRLMERGLQLAERRR